MEYGRLFPLSRYLGNLVHKTERFLGSRYSAFSSHQQQGRHPVLPAVYGNGPVLTELFLGLVHLSNKVNKAFAHLWNSLLRPVGELELTYCSRLAVLKTITVTPMTHLPEISAKNRYSENRYRFLTRLPCSLVPNFSGMSFW